MRKVLFLLLALMMNTAVNAQEIEKIDKFASGYINGTFMNKYKTIDGVLYAVGYEGTKDWILVRYPAGSRNTTYIVHPNCRRIAQGEQITFKDLMSSRVAYYPGSGYDGTLIKVCNKSHSAHSFLYVDYLVKRKELEDHIAQKNSFLGYHPIGKIEWRETDLMPNGQYPFVLSKKPLHGTPNTFVDPYEKPYCFSLILERDEDRDDSWGAEHFVVTFLYADGIATYYQLFVKEYSKAPWIFLLQDHGFGCNYDCFGKGGILDAIIQENHCYPQYVICASNTRIWNGYEQVENVSPVYGGMHQQRRDIYHQQTL